MSRLKVEMCKVAVFTSSVFHILSFPYRLQSHSWGARSLTFFIFIFFPSNTLFFISHFFPNSYPPCCSTLTVNSLFCLWEISPLHYSVTGCGVEVGVGAPICYWKPAWNLFFISAAFNCVYAYNYLHCGDP